MYRMGMHWTWALVKETDWRKGITQMIARTINPEYDGISFYMGEPDENTVAYRPDADLPWESQKPYAMLLPTPDHRAMYWETEDAWPKAQEPFQAWLEGPWVARVKETIEAFGPEYVVVPLYTKC